MVIVRFRRNAPPYAAGELAGFPTEKADRLEQEGVVERHLAEEDAPAAPDAFDPATADAAALRAFLMERGVSVHHKTGEAKLRELAAAELAKE
ncbi:hypothetical protein TSH7_01275 [Azospirillum sp. TSH7]|uniref:hypothetical protein n=1 Tax=unclassified Azospirillum TaxID=2630922 RepID=UPI000D60377A|nr:MULTISPECIES: hypothetical protein [unclassified Azospirillum]PWC69105.1 hypothetical protein TSH7_01275 [Azospirillum sp. TSH7]PWC71403.1 hypothetical protein TSH20_03800 [Azospirillum sp. TSH20]